MKTLKQNKSLLIFAEGCLSNQHHAVNSLKTGAIRLALETNTPIIPIGITVDPANIRSKHCVLNKSYQEARWCSGGYYYINFGQPILIKGDRNDRKFVKLKTRELHQQVTQLINPTKIDRPQPNFSLQINQIYQKLMVIILFSKLK